MLIQTTYAKDEKHSLQEMGERILKGFFEASNQGNDSLIHELYAPDALIHTLEGPKQGPGVIVEIFQKWRHAFPDFHLEPLLLVQEVDVLVVHWRGIGTFTNSLRDISPTGKSVTLHGFTCFRCMDDRIIEHWARVDYRPLSEADCSIRH